MDTTPQYIVIEMQNCIIGTNAWTYDKYGIDPESEPESVTA